MPLDIDGFLDDLDQQLSNNTEGFSIHIQYQAPNTVQDSRVGNYTIDPADPGAQNWNIKSIRHVASVSKLVTAVAMTRALRDYEISPDTAISGYSSRTAHLSKGPSSTSISTAGDFWAYGAMLLGMCGRLQ